MSARIGKRAQLWRQEGCAWFGVLFAFPPRWSACSVAGSCHACPNTAWLLFLLFSIGLVVLVALSVYLSKKRLNLAVLGIGVVRKP